MKKSEMWENGASFLERHNLAKAAYYRPTPFVQFDEFCTLGALLAGNALATKSELFTVHGISDKVRNLLQDVCYFAHGTSHPYADGHFTSVASFNDRPSTTKEVAVRAMRDMAEIYRKHGE